MGADWTFLTLGAVALAAVLVIGLHPLYTILVWAGLQIAREALKSHKEEG
jgi:hypothetical protein